MAETFYLQKDTYISDLVSQGLADGDFIQLKGFNLIVDIDMSPIAISILNNGTDANIELKDRSRICLNSWQGANRNAYCFNTSNIHLHVNSNIPLPFLDNNYLIDNDGYRTNLTANARAEIQIKWAYGLGGGNIIYQQK